MNPPSGLKKFVKKLPVIGSTARRIAALPAFADARRRAFRGSASFWEDRYRSGGTSGSGSYGHLAEFKAAILNDFVLANHIHTVIEFGCGDGAQLELANYPHYVGVDVATAAVERCSLHFVNDSSKCFYLADALPKDLGTFDLALSLDVIFHLVEDFVFHSYMHTLFRYSRHYVAIYASNYEALTESRHVRHRNFAQWIARNMPDWRPAGFVPNRYPFDPSRPDETSFSDFHFFARVAT
jgi:hypothetical protein